MPDIGTVTGTLSLADKFSATIDAVITRVDKLESQNVKTAARVQSETDKIAAAYKKLAGSLDPTVAAHNKFESALGTLGAALEKGVITQHQHNEALEQAREKFLGAHEKGSLFHELIEKLTHVTSAAGGATAEMGEKLEGITGRFGGLVSVLGELGPLLPVVIGLAAAVGAFAIAFEGFEILKDIVSEGMKAQVTVEALNQSIRSNGAAAGYSSAQLIEMAGGLVNVSGKSEAAIVAGETILTRFDKIGHEVFPLAVKGALDYAQATGKDLPTAFEKIGPLLAGNAKSLTALKEIGDVMTSGQKKTAAQMIENGQIYQYQMLVLDALSHHVGGAAAAYAKTLSGAIAIAQANLEGAKETIASEIIPALQFLANNLIKSAGGWDTIREVIQGFAHYVGNAIRRLVYDIIINYHEWRANTEDLRTAMAKAFRGISDTIFDAIVAIHSALGKLPGGDIFKSAADDIKALQDKIHNSLLQSEIDARLASIAQTSLAESAKAALAKHTLALAGNEDAAKKTGSALDDLAKKNDKAKNAIDTAAKAIRDYTIKFDEMRTKLSTSVDEQEKLSLALNVSVYAYDQLKLAQERYNKITAEVLTLTHEHRAEIDKLEKSQKELAQAGKSSDASKIADDIKKSNIAFEDQRKNIISLTGANFDLMHSNALKLDQDKLTLQFGIDLLASQAAITDARNQDTLAAQNLATQLVVNNAIDTAGAQGNIALAAYIEGTIRARRAQIAANNDTVKSINLVLKGEQQLLDDQIKFRDNQQLREATQLYGKDLADLYQKYGLLSDASRTAQIDQAAQAAEAASDHTRSVADIRADLQLIEDKRVKQAQEYADFEAQEIKRHQLMVDVASALDLISQSAGISSPFGKMAGDASKLVSALEAVRTAANGVQKALAAAAAVNIGAALLKDLNIGGMSKTGGVSTLGGALEGNYAGIGSAIGTVLGAIIGAIVSWGSGAGPGAALGSAIGAVLGGLISKAGDSASASLTAGGNIKIGETSDKLNGAVKDALTNIFKGLSDVLAKLGIFSTSAMPLIDIKIRDNIVRVVVGTVVRTFSSISDAISFGISEALKQLGPNSGGHLPPELIAALKNTTATDMTALQSDIDFAMQIANYGVPQVVQALNKSVGDFFEAMHRAASLGIDTTKVVAEFARQVQAEKDGILGVNRNLSPADQMRKDAAAFNAREQLLKAQEQLDLADLQFKKSDLEAKIIIAKAQVGVQKAVDQTVLDGIKAMEAALGSIDIAIAAAQGIIDGIVLISDKELQDALRHIRTGGGGAGAVDAKAQMNAELDKLTRTNIGSLLQGVFDLAAQLNDLTKRTKDAKGSEDLLLKARQALIDQQKLAIRASVSDYLDPSAGGTFGQSDYQKNIAAIQKQFDDARAANAKLLADTGQRAVAFWKLNQAELRALNKAAESLIGSLGLPMEQSRAAAETLATTIANLQQAMSSGAISADRYSQVVGELAAKTGSELLSSAETILNSMGQTQEAAKVKAALDEANFDLQVAQLNFLYQQYLALGLISDSVKKTLDAALAIINDPRNHPDFGGGTTGGFYGLDPAAVAADKAMVAGGGTGTNPLQAAIDLLNKYTVDGLDPLTKSLRSINADFMTIRTALGNTPAVITAYNNAVQAAINNFTSQVRQTQQQLFYGQQSTADIATKFAQAKLDFATDVARFNAGDLTVVADVPNMVQNLLQLAQQATPTGSTAYTDIFRQANGFLSQILALTPNQVAGSGVLGSSSTNPMNIAGMDSLVSASQGQYEVLGEINTSSALMAQSLAKMASTPGTGLPRAA